MDDASEEVWCAACSEGPVTQGGPPCFDCVSLNADHHEDEPCERLPSRGPAADLAAAREEIAALKEELRAANGFHDVAVQQRDRNQCEIDALKSELAKLRETAGNIAVGLAVDLDMHKDISDLLGALGAFDRVAGGHAWVGSNPASLQSTTPKGGDS